jgi:phosphate transport system protein
MELVKNQLEQSTKALITHDIELAEEILRKEIRVNALELNIEKECENSIALYQPVATELRFVLSIFKSISELERMGDHAEFTAKAIVERNEKAFSENYIKLFYINEMNELIIQMFDNIIEAFETKNSNIARKVFKSDKDVNKIYKLAIENFQNEINTNKSQADEILMMYSICSRMERSGDLITNLAEEIIFYLEAEVLKHKKMKYKMKEKKNDK